MSTNVEIVRRSIEAFNGHNGLREFLALNWEPWEFVTTQIDQLIDLGDDVVLLNRNRARGRGSQVDLDQARGAIFRVRNGKIVRVRFYDEPQKALEAAGLPAEQTHS